MAKTKSDLQKKHKKFTETPEQLYDTALTCLEAGEPDQALKAATKLLKLVDPDLASSASSKPTKREALPALNLLGEISVELGDVESAQKYFLLAVEADPDGHIPEAEGGGAEKFLWLAQLSETGGADSVRWFEQGVEVLKKEIAVLEAASGVDPEEKEVLLDELRGKVANALCAVTEIYMTDLSWEEDAEARCEVLVTEALLFAPDSPETLQTLASVRLSQLKVEDARSALERSLSLWRDLDPEDDAIPEFPARVSLARLLMEAEMEETAMEVLHRLALDDDQSVEACYLGGWCLYLLAQKRDSARRDGAGSVDEIEGEMHDTLKASRRWLLNTLKLYQLLDYEDDRLLAHTKELVEELNGHLGPLPEGQEEEDDEEDWVAEDGNDDDDDDADDQEMADG